MPRFRGERSGAAGFRRSARQDGDCARRRPALAHQARGLAGWTPFTLWRDGNGQFDDYQSVQAPAKRARLNAPFWASFVVTPAATTVFVGLCDATRTGTAPPDRIGSLSGKTEAVLGSIDPDLYALQPLEALSVYNGRRTVDWGPGMRSWIQRADDPLA